MTIDLSPNAAKARESVRGTGCHAQGCTEAPVAIIRSCEEDMHLCFEHYKRSRHHMAKAGHCPYCGKTAAVDWEVIQRPLSNHS